MHLGSNGLYFAVLPCTGAPSCVHFYPRPHHKNSDHIAMAKATWHPHKALALAPVAEQLLVTTTSGPVHSSMLVAVVAHTRGSTPANFEHRLQLTTMPGMQTSELVLVALPKVVVVHVGEAVVESLEGGNSLGAACL